MIQSLHHYCWSLKQDIIRCRPKQKSKRKSTILQWKGILVRQISKKLEFTQHIPIKILNFKVLSRFYNKIAEKRQIEEVQPMNVKL